MTIEKRALRASKMRNKIIAKEFPLFLDQFATNPDRERVRINECIAQNEMQMGKQEELSKKFLSRGEEYRQLARSNMKKEDWESYDKRFRQVITFDDPVYFCTWWHTKCRDLGLLEVEL